MKKEVKDPHDEVTGHSQLTMQVVEHVRSLISSEVKFIRVTASPPGSGTC